MWNGEKDKDLINFVTDNECLYNVKCKENRKTHEKENHRTEEGKLNIICLNIIISVCFLFQWITCMNFLYFTQIQADVHNVYKNSYCSISS